MKRVIFFLFLIIFLVLSCRDNPFVEKVYSIRVYNNSQKRVTTFYQKNYPDTNLSNPKPLLSEIKPNDYIFIDSRKKWEEVFSEAPKDTLSFYNISSDTLSTYSWDIIISRYNILKRYDLSLQDLQNLNWRITYP